MTVRGGSSIATAGGGGRVAQVDDERVEVVGQAAGCGGVAGAVQFADQRLEALLGVALAEVCQ